MQTTYELIFILTFFFFNDTATTEIYTLSLHDALPIWSIIARRAAVPSNVRDRSPSPRTLKLRRSEEHTSKLQSPDHLVCRLLLEKKKTRWSRSCWSSRVTCGLIPRRPRTSWTRSTLHR